MLNAIQKKPRSTIIIISDDDEDRESAASWDRMFVLMTNSLHVEAERAINIVCCAFAIFNARASSRAAELEIPSACARDHARGELHKPRE